MENALCHPSNVYNFEVAPRYLENLLNPRFILLVCTFPYGLERKVQMNILEYIFNSQLTEPTKLILAWW
jgi:hypothetical protein